MAAAIEDQRLDHHGGAVKHRFDVEGIIEARVDYGVGSERLSVAEQFVPGFALDDSLVSLDLVTLNSRLCRGQNHFPPGFDSDPPDGQRASREGQTLVIHPLYIRGNENGKTPKGSEKNFTGGLGGGRASGSLRAGERANGAETFSSGLR